MTADDVPHYVGERLPTFTVAGTPVRLPEGNLNVVWRVPGTERALIVKYAPPYIAANPEVPLDPSRMAIEARCLEALGPEGELASVSRSGIRPPRMIDVNLDEHVLIMEDVGSVPFLDRWIRREEEDRVQQLAPTLGRRLGQFIGRLHKTTYADDEAADAFDNGPMQQTRHAVQYRGVADMLKQADVSDAEALGERARALGEELLEPGQCLTMGDLWPRSVLVVKEKLRLIDWELAHFGRPLQDVAHWDAHLWMQAHQASSVKISEAVEVVRSTFFSAYRAELGDTFEDLWTADERRNAAVHVGAEILVRAVGPFQDGYVYEGWVSDHPEVREAVTTAADCLRAPAEWELFE